MSYRDRLRAGSWRGVAFEILESRAQFGRRTVRHEYPLRDEPFVEDLGRETRIFSVTGFVVGDNYDLDKERMIAATETGDSGVLIHPYYGRLDVTVESFEISERADAGRQFTFSATWVEAGALTFPSVTPDSISALASTASLARSSVSAVLVARYDVTAAGFLKEAAEARITALLDDVDAALDPFRHRVTDIAAFEDLLSDITATVSTLAADPAEFSTQIFDLLDLADAREIMTQLADALATPTAVSAPTPLDQQNADNLAGLDLLVRRASLIEAAELAIAEVFTSTDEALAVRDDLSGRLALELESTDLDDPAFEALTDLRTDLNTDLTTDAAQLPELVDLTFEAVTSTLEIAQRRYGDGDRNTEISDRNAIVHPGFVTGLVQVLSQ